MKCGASKTNGIRCAAWAIKGTNVCRVHGGSAPQVRAAARLRLAALIDPAIGQLRKLITAKHPPTSLGAVRDVLDRNDLKTPDKLEMSGPGGAPIQREELLRLSEEELTLWRQFMQKVKSGAESGTA